MGIHADTLQKLYVAYFSRPADPGGLAYWEEILTTGRGDISTVTAAFANSVEYRETYAGKTPSDVVRAVYQNLFNRPAEDEGLKFWGDALAKGDVTVDVAVTAIAAGAQNDDLIFFNNKVRAGTAFTNALNEHPEQAAYSGDAAQAAAKAFTATITSNASVDAALARLDLTVAEFVAASQANISFTLTANADKGVAFTGGGGNDSFHATGATLSAGDELNGGGGANQLWISADGALPALPEGVKVRNMQGVSISAKGAVGGAQAWDASAFGALQSIRVSTTSGDVNLKTGSASFASVDGNTGAAVLSGDQLIAVALSNTSQAATIDNTTVDHTMALTLDKVTGGAVVSDAQAASLSMTVKGDSVIQPQFAKATLLTIKADAALKLDTTALAAADKLAALTLGGAGGLEADLSGILPLAKVDASASSSTNKLVVASASGLSVLGGTGQDSLILTGKLHGAAQVALGVGDDWYDFSLAASAGAKVDGGAGADTIVVNDGALLDLDGIYTGFEVLDFSSGKGDYDLGRAGSVTSLVASAKLRDEAVNFSNGRAGSSITFYSTSDAKLDFENDVVFALKDSGGASDQLRISLMAVDGSKDGVAKGSVTARSVEAKGIEEVTLVSGVVNGEGGPYANAISYLHIDDARTVKLGGTAHLDISTIYSNVLTLIDATAASGDIKLSSALTRASENNLNYTYLGGSGRDYIYGSEKAVVFQGNAGADTILLERDNGKDVIKIAKASDSLLNIGADGNPNFGFDDVYWFKSGSDTFDLSGLKLADGANRGGIARHKLLADNDANVAALVKNGAGFFNDGGTNRSLAYANDGSDGYLFIDIDADGNYNGGVDTVLHVLGTPTLAVGDFMFG
jgi:hypothetical protein